jgi:hypothetical protein
MKKFLFLSFVGSVFSVSISGYGLSQEFIDAEKIGEVVGISVADKVNKGSIQRGRAAENEIKRMCYNSVSDRYLDLCITKAFLSYFPDR